MKDVPASWQRRIVPFFEEKDISIMVQRIWKRVGEEYSGMREEKEKQEELLKKEREGRWRRLSVRMAAWCWEGDKGAVYLWSLLRVSIAVEH